jgi:hypothetical protein
MKILIFVFKNNNNNDDNVQCLFEKWPALRLFCGAVLSGHSSSRD